MLLDKEGTRAFSSFPTAFSNSLNLMLCTSLSIALGSSSSYELLAFLIPIICRFQVRGVCSSWVVVVVLCEGNWVVGGMGGEWGVGGGFIGDGGGEVDKGGCEWRGSRGGGMGGGKG